MGGQLQRVAIARSLVANPKMLLMDEPFSALDTLMRRQMQELLVELFQKSEMQDLDPTVVIVTHDIKEAVYLANDIYIMQVNPSCIKEHIKADLGIRSEDLRRSSRFLEIVDHIESII